MISRKKKQHEQTPEWRELSIQRGNGNLWLAGLLSSVVPPLQAALPVMKDALCNKSLRLEGFQSKASNCYSSSSSPVANVGRNYCAANGPDEGVSPDEGNIKLAGNGLQLNTAQGQ